MDDLIINYIKNCFKRGIPKATVISYLTEKGYPQEQIREAVTKAEKETRLTTKTPKIKEVIKYSIISILILFFILIGTFFLVNIINIPRPVKCFHLENMYNCLAVAENNQTHCEEITNETSKNKCYDLFFGIRALKENNTELCKNIKMSAEAYLCEVIIGGNVNACDEIKNKDIKAYCMASILKNPELCSEVSDNLEMGRDACIDYVGFLKAFSESNITICNEMRHDLEKAQCRAVLSQDSSVCEREYASECYRQ